MRSSAHKMKLYFQVSFSFPLPLSLLKFLILGPATDSLKDVEFIPR